MLVFLLKPFLKAKFISSFHGLNKDEVFDTKLKRSFLDLWLEKISLKKSHLLIFPSKLLSEQFNQHYKFPAIKSIIIPNGISEIFNEKKIK